MLSKSAYGGMFYSPTGAPAIGQAFPDPATPAPRPQFARRGGVSPSAIAGRQSTGASPTAPVAARNVAAAQANVPVVMPDQVDAQVAAAPKAIPVAEGPTPGQLQQFQRDTRTPYNPKSSLDAAKMNGLMSGQKNWADNAWARGQMNGGQQKTAYLQGLKDMGSGALEYAGNKVKSVGNAAAAGLGSIGAGIGAGLSGGGLRGAADAMDSTYNAGMATAKQQGAAADAGWNKMNAGGVRAGQQIENFGNGMSEYVGNSLGAPTDVSVGLRSVGAGLGAGLSGGGLRGAADAMDSVYNSGKAQQSQMLGSADAGWNKMTNNGGATNPNPDPNPWNRVPAGGSAFASLGPSAPQPAAQVAAPPAATPGGTAAQAGQIAAPVTTPAAQSAPTPGQLQQFQGGTTTPFNPKSPLDKAKMQGLMGGQKNWADNAWARGQMGKSGSALAFAMLEKGAAGGLAGMAVKGLRSVGGKLVDLGRRAKSTAGRTAMTQANQPSATAIGTMDDATRHRIVTEARRGVGDSRRNIGRSLQDAAHNLNNSKGAQKAINYGGGGLLGGGALYGSNRLGHASGEIDGRAKGVTEGFDNGTQVGMAAAQAAAPGDPGIMGRLAQVFTGSGGGPDMGAAQQNITNNRDSLIQSILAGR